MKHHSMQSLLTWSCRKLAMLDQTRRSRRCLVPKPYHSLRARAPRAGQTLGAEGLSRPPLKISHSALTQQTYVIRQSATKNKKKKRIVLSDHEGKKEKESTATGSRTQASSYHSRGLFIYQGGIGGSHSTLKLLRHCNHNRSYLLHKPSTC
jgi:hypothetical protein